MLSQKKKMKDKKTLKEKNVKQIWLFFGLNLIAFLIVVFTFSLKEDAGGLGDILYRKGIWFLLSPLIVFILNGLVSANQKAALISWRGKDNLPGCRAFTYYAIRDSRINLKRLKELHGDLPTLPADQNAKWYSIYKTYHSDVIISKSHQDYLLARDLCTFSFLTVLLLPIPVLVFGDHPMKYIYLIALALQYLVLVIVAQNYGARFVCNVLALESTK